VVAVDEGGVRGAQQQEGFKLAVAAEAARNGISCRSPVTIEVHPCRFSQEGSGSDRIAGTGAQQAAAAAATTHAGCVCQLQLRFRLQGAALGVEKQAVAAAAGGAWIGV
jgi:hypothetical protein